LLQISEQLSKIIKVSKQPNSPHGSRPLTFYQVNSVIWSYQYFLLLPEFEAFQKTIVDYLEHMIDINSDITSKFNMSIDLE